MVSVTQPTAEQELAKLRAIMSRYRKSNGLVSYLNDTIDKRDEWTISRLLRHKDLDGIMEYHISQEIKVLVKRPSIIKEYTNKKGHSHMAHFTLYHKYLGSVRTLGDEPIPTDFYVVPERETFYVTDEGKVVEGLKPTATFIYDSDDSDSDESLISVD